MKRPLLCALALLLTAGAAAAQNEETVVVLHIDGFTREDRDGTIYHRCASDLCAPRSRVSYRRQTHRPELPLSAFEAHHRRLSENAPKYPDSTVRSSTVHDFAETTIDGVRILSTLREVVWKSGSKTSHIDALMIGKARSYSVISDAEDMQQALRNMKIFLPRLIDLASLQI
jgi:hypothetical protein